jgi:L-alanine-DL-glutamate epimerase-like enolase superfamily enzyme
MTQPPRFTLRDIALYERDIPFRKPFRFGAVTVDGTAQAFVRVEIQLPDGRTATGATAELMVPKWFDKNPALSTGETIDELRRALFIARETYLARQTPLSAFALHAEAAAEHAERCAAEHIPPLAAAFGPAQLDKAVLDALLRAHDMDVFRGLAANIAGLDERLTSDIDDVTIRQFLSSRQPLARVALRHTIGMVDPLTGEGGLAEIVAAYGCRTFKIKLGGNPEDDVARLVAIHDELARLGINYRATVDANEQYADLASLTELCDALDGLHSLVLFREKLLYIEQPLPRELALATPLGALAERFSFIIDEADDSYDAFPSARELGYRGISSKSCKGIYKSLLNGARAMAWNADAADEGAYFISAEDLTCQAGLAVQQDTALVAFHGITHAERNGHHYVDGFAGAPASEQAAFAEAHADLYRRTGSQSRLLIEDGSISTRSLGCTGFASAVAPEWTSMAPLKEKGAA